MFLVLRPTDQPALATVEKFVLGVWPLLDGDRYVTSVCNLSLTVAVAPSSPCALSRLVLLAEQRFFDPAVQVMDVAHTLLDAGNPLTHTTNGRYRIAAGGRALARYDGLADVEVHDGARFVVCADEKAPYRRLDISLPRPIEPAQRAAVRFCFPAPGMFAAAFDGELRFRLTFQSDFPICQLADDGLYVPRTLALLSVSGDGVAGGLDVFLFMPLEYEGECFNLDPVARLLPDYDHLGRRISRPRLKYCWSGQMLCGRPGTLIEIGQRITIDGRFRRRQMSAVNNNFNRVEGDVFTAPVSATLVGSRAAVRSVAGSPDAQALEALERLRTLIAMYVDERDAELARSHAGAIELAIREGRPGQARGRLAALASACGACAQSTLPILEAIDSLGRLL